MVNQVFQSLLHSECRAAKDTGRFKFIAGRVMLVSTQRCICDCIGDRKQPVLHRLFGNTYGGVVNMVTIWNDTGHYGVMVHACTYKTGFTMLQWTHCVVKMGNR